MPDILRMVAEGQLDPERLIGQDQAEVEATAPPKVPHTQPPLWGQFQPDSGTSLPGLVKLSLGERSRWSRALPR